MYSSKRAKNCNKQEIERILKSSETNNPDLGITGILLHSKTEFFQYLEGDIEDLFNLYAKIKEDPRHNHVSFLGAGILRNRLFPIWNMGFKNIKNNLQLMIENSNEVNSTFHETFSKANELSPRVVKAMRQFFFQT